MGSARNAKQLNAMIMKDLKKAAHIASEKMLADMYDETGDFYAGGEPIMYQRTGALGDTPRTTSVDASSTVDGGSVSFKAYLDTSAVYTTGKGPSMKTVLDLANNGGDMTNPPMRAVVGKPGFWDRAEEKMEESFKETMEQFF